MSDVFEAVRDFVELGGDVLLLVGVLTFAMWLLILERLFYLHTRHHAVMKAAIAKWTARADWSGWCALRVRERLMSNVSQGLERNLSLIGACVALCPLVGLLGTVTGMIEVFEAMALSGSGNPRLIAAGVSKATLPTMAGMVAALSGIFVNAWLKRQAQRERARLGERMTASR